MVLTPVTINSIRILNAIGLHQNFENIEQIAHRFGSVSEIFNHFGSIFVPFRKFSGAFWDVLTQFVKIGSSPPKMNLLHKFYTQFNQFL